MDTTQPRLADDLTSPGVASDLTDVIKRGRPVLWIDGHTHNLSDYCVGGTSILCDPKGYGPTAGSPPIENASFDKRLVVEL